LAKEVYLFTRFSRYLIEETIEQMLFLHYFITLNFAFTYSPPPANRWEGGARGVGPVEFLDFCHCKFSVIARNEAI